MEVSAEFLHKRYGTTLRLPGTLTTEPSESDKLKRIYRRAESIEIVLKDSGTALPISNLLPEESHPELSKLIEGLVLRVLRVIRNIGGCPEIPETLKAEGELKARLKRWGTEYSTDGGTWIPVIPSEPSALAFVPFGFAGLIRGEEFAHTAWLSLRLWPHIVEMLEDTKEISPEDEFRTNTVAHLASQNYRLAVLEAIICLEIVLSEFLRAELEVGKKLPEDRVKIFLDDLDLKARLAVMLDYVLHESYLKDLDLVLKVVRWRNKITHDRGRLPDIPDETLRAGVSAVLELAKGLAERRDGIRAQSEMNAIGEKLKSKHKDVIFTTSVRLFPWHQVEAKVTFCIPPAPDYAYPSEDALLVLVDEAAELFKERDPRFERDKHLSMKFLNLSGKEQWSFYHGIIPPPRSSKKEDRLS